LEKKGSKLIDVKEVGQSEGLFVLGNRVINENFFCIEKYNSLYAGVVGYFICYLIEACQFF